MLLCWQLKYLNRTVVKIRYNVLLLQVFQLDIRTILGLKRAWQKQKQGVHIAK